MKLASNLTHEITQKFAGESIEVGGWLISEQFGILNSSEGKSLTLEPRLAKLMYHLCLYEASIVSRDHLIEHIWQETVVNEESLTRAIADLRKKLAKAFDRPPMIETIPKRGYKINVLPKPRIYALKLRLKKVQFYQLLIGILFVTVVVLSWVLFHN